MARETWNHPETILPFKVKINYCLELEGQMETEINFTGL